MQVKVAKVSGLPGRVLRRIVRSWRRYVLNDPIAQIYINDGDIESFIGINNFYSFLAPMNKEKKIAAKLVFYAENGVRIFAKKILIHPWTGLNINISDLFIENKISSRLGSVSLQLSPRIRGAHEYKAMGLISSHFYMFYKDKNGSIAHIHPSNNFSISNKHGGDWISNQQINVEGLEEVVLYQLNPTPNICEVTHSLIRIEDGNLNSHCQNLRSVTNLMAPWSVSKVAFSKSNFQHVRDHLTIKIQPIPGPNAKPLLLRRFANSQFSISHS